MLDDEARNGSCNEDHQIRILVGLYSGNVRHIHTRRSRKITHDTHVLACKLHFDNMPPCLILLHKSCSPGKKGRKKNHRTLLELNTKKKISPIIMASGVDAPLPLVYYSSSKKFC